MDYRGSWIVLYAAAGATSWKIQSQSVSMAPPASVGVPGTVSWEEYGTFVGTVTGATTSPTANFSYSRIGKVVTLELKTNLSFTKNGTTGVIGITGLPANITPSVTAYASLGAVSQSGTIYAANVWAESSSQLTYYKTAAEDGFSASAGIGIVRSTITYKMP